jgi:hypothetical protein
MLILIDLIVNFFLNKDYLYQFKLNLYFLKIPLILSRDFYFLFIILGFEFIVN